MSDTNGVVTFQYVDNEGQEMTRSLPGGEFLWLLLLHVLPRRFRRVRDFGLLHANAKRLVQIVQLILNVRACHGLNHQGKKANHLPKM